jgi:hypothetical protein
MTKIKFYYSVIRVINHHYPATRMDGGDVRRITRKRKEPVPVDSDSGDDDSDKDGGDPHDPEYEPEPSTDDDMFVPPTGIVPGMSLHETKKLSTVLLEYMPEDKVSEVCDLHQS